VHGLPGYSKHEFACIPMAAIHIKTSSVRVPVASIQVNFLCGSCLYATHMSKHTLLPIYTAHSEDMTTVTSIMSIVHCQQHNGDSEIN